MWKPLHDQLAEEIVPKELNALSSEHPSNITSSSNNMDPHDIDKSLRLEDDDLFDQSYAGMDAEVHSLSESFISGVDRAAAVIGGADDAAASGIMLLNQYCARAKAPKDTEESKVEADLSWQPIRELLSTCNAEEVRDAAEQRGESGLTALHFACRNVPPLDVIDVFLSIAEDTVRWPDSFGWLPIHYACASGSDSNVIKALAEAFPESKTIVDRRGRTPLHFALGDKPAAPDVIMLLSSTGAAGYADDNGMLPLHYACAFGASEEVLYVLTEAYPEAIKTKDKRQRTPLHFALSNAGRRTVPAAVRLLLSLNRDIVNSIDNGPVPLRVLAEYAATIKTDDEDRVEKRESVVRCLNYLLNADPVPTASFFTALQSLPDWLSERAVVMPKVQILLNEKISRPFPTAVLMLDFYIQVMVIVSYSLNVTETITNLALSSSDTVIATTPSVKLVPLYLGTAYFLFREIIQVISLLSLKSFNIWLYDPSNYLNVAYVLIILFWTVEMHTGGLDGDVFRIGAAISVTIVWVKLVAYLRNVMIDFAVFVGGVFYVVRRLAAFLTALCVILIAFTQMFFTVFQQSEYCKDQPIYDETPEEIVMNARCTDSSLRSYCTFWNAFLNIYTMLLGEVNPTVYTRSTTATILFVLFMFLVVILLANVLIAIVTDSYKVIQDQRAAIVFWTNRLDFVAEMDGIANGPWKGRIRKVFGWCKSAEPSSAASPPQFGKELWKQIVDLFDDEVEGGMMSCEFLAYVVLRIFTALFVIPCWVLLGILTVGWLWPPQVREAVVTSTVMKHSSDSEMQNELRKTQVRKLQQEVQSLNDELKQELALDRTQVFQIKSHVAERKLEIANEIRHIRRIVGALFERQSA